MSIKVVCDICHGVCNSSRILLVELVKATPAQVWPVALQPIFDRKECCSIECARAAAHMIAQDVPYQSVATVHVAQETPSDV